MTDREGNAYVMLTIGIREIPVCLMSPARQEKKAFAQSVGGISGRQWVKHRKALRHIARGHIHD